MNHMPTLNRRAFVIGSAAIGSGLALGLDIPFGGPTVVRAADGAPEVNAWVVIRPDDTVVIRIARSEMGQGTLTGLAQLVAEELECDWSKVTTEYPTPGQSVARKRVWGDFSTGGSRGIRASTRLRAQGRRHRARHADPGRRQRMEGAGFGMHRRQQRHHPHALGPQDDLRQGGGSRREARAAGRRQAEGPEGLEADRQGRQAARHGRQDHRQEGLRHRHQAAGHAQCRDQGLPGVRRQGEELRRGQDHRHEGRQEGGAGRRQRRRRRRRHLVARQDRARRPADRLGRRRQRQGLQRLDREVARGGLRPAAAGLSSATRTATPRRRSPARPRRSRRSTTIPTRTTPRWSR